jgi:hypothetical protein
MPVAVYQDESEAVHSRRYCQGGQEVPMRGQVSVVPIGIRDGDDRRF